jgi:hypothetical protein
MTRKNALYALAVAVFMGSMAVAALADDHGMNVADPESSIGLDVGVIRGPMETGAVPDRSASSSEFGEFGSGNDADEPTVEIAGQTYRLNIDLGGE